MHLKRNSTKSFSAEQHKKNECFGEVYDTDDEKVYLYLMACYL